MAKRVLGELGYTVLSAADGYEALDVLARFAGEVHLLITDVVMPKMSGRELVARVTALRPEIPNLQLDIVGGGWWAQRLIDHAMLLGIADAVTFHGHVDDETKHSVLQQGWVQLLPSRVNKIFDALSRSELRLKVEMIDEGAVIDGLQKVANRIATGLVLAALIVGAAMLMQIDTPFTILGYPGLAIMFFVFAAAGGLWLAFRILASDRTPGPRVRS